MVKDGKISLDRSLAAKKGGGNPILFKQKDKQGNKQGDKQGDKQIPEKSFCYNLLLNFHSYFSVVRNNI